VVDSAWTPLSQQPRGRLLGDTLSVYLAQVSARVPPRQLRRNGIARIRISEPTVGEKAQRIGSDEHRGAGVGKDGHP
jgi:hypothetical protein